MNHIRTHSDGGHCTNMFSVIQLFYMEGLGDTVLFPQRGLGKTVLKFSKGTRGNRTRSFEEDQVKLYSSF